MFIGEFCLGQCFNEKYLSFNVLAGKFVLEEHAYWRTHTHIYIYMRMTPDHAG